MSGLLYIFWAFAIIWVGVGLYLVRLGSLRRELEDRVSRFEDRLGRRTDEES